MSSFPASVLKSVSNREVEVFLWFVISFASWFFLNQVGDCHVLGDYVKGKRNKF